VKIDPQVENRRGFTRIRTDFSRLIREYPC
jgi:hypothetical protein